MGGLISPMHSDFGNADEFVENVLKTYGISGIAPEFDEYTVLDKNAMFEDQAAMIDQDLELTGRLDRIEALLLGGGGRRKKADGKKTESKKKEDKQEEKSKK